MWFMELRPQLSTRRGWSWRVISSSSVRCDKSRCDLNLVPPREFQLLSGITSLIMYFLFLPVSLSAHLLIPFEITPPNKLFALNCLSQHLLLGEPNLRHTLWKSFTYSYKHSVNLNWTFFSSWCFIFEVEDGFYNLKMVFTKGVLNLYPWIEMLLEMVVINATWNSGKRFRFPMYTPYLDLTNQNFRTSLLVRINFGLPTIYLLSSIGKK